MAPMKIEEEVKRTIDGAVERLAGCVDDPFLTQEVAKRIAEYVRASQYRFGAVRTNSLNQLRDEGYSLQDMREEIQSRFGERISRARISAMINREERRDLRKEDQKKQRRGG